MAKKVSKAKYRQMEKLIEQGKKAVKRAKRNAHISTAVMLTMDFLLGLFISSLRFSFAGLENIGFVMVWIGLFFSVIASLLFALSSLNDYYKQVVRLDDLEEDFEKMEV